MSIPIPYTAGTAFTIDTTKLGFSITSCFKIGVSRLYYGTSTGTLLFDKTTSNLVALLGTDFINLDTTTKQLTITPNKAVACATNVNNAHMLGKDFSDQPLLTVVLGF